MQFPFYAEISQKVLLYDIFWENLKHEKVPDWRFGSELAKLRKIVTFIIFPEFYNNLNYKTPKLTILSYMSLIISNMHLNIIFWD